MTNIWRWLALFGPLLQFGMALLSVFVTDFIDLETKYGLPEPLYLLPAGPAFLIWNIIFLSYIALGIYQLRQPLRTDARWVQARPYVFFSCLGNSVWFLGDFSTNLTVSLFGFLIMLLTLTRLNHLFELSEKSPNGSVRWFVKFPISIFYGWVSVAFPIGVTLWLMADLGLEAGNPTGVDRWSSAILMIAFGLFSFLWLTQRVSLFYSAVGVWGFFWIYIGNSGSDRLLTDVALAVTLLLLIQLLLVRLWPTGKESKVAALPS